VAAVFAIASAVFGALTTWLNPGSMAGSFAQTSRGYASAASDIDSFRRLELPGATGGGERSHRAAKAKLIKLQEDLSRIRESSPEVPDWALRATRTKTPDLSVMVAPSPPPLFSRLPWR